MKNDAPVPPNDAGDEQTGGDASPTGPPASRTIVLALWDGEEWGLLGSTEWAEKHAAELRQKAVATVVLPGGGLPCRSLGCI